MVNRRHIRIKVMQTLYGIFKSKNDDLTKEEKYLLYSVHKAMDLYVLQMRLLVEVKNLASEHLEIKKKKFLATAEDKNPNAKFIQNELIRAIENSDDINNFIVKKNLINWKDDREYVRVVWDLIQENESYKKYISTNNSSLKEDKEFVGVIFKEIIAPNEKLFDYYESINLGWVDDLPLVNTSVLKSIKQFKKGNDFSLRELETKEDDQEFLI